MIVVQGLYFDGRSSTRVEVLCRVYDSGALQVERQSDQTLLIKQPRFDATVSDRLGNTPRYLHFPGGEKIETLDNDAVDDLLRQHSRPSRLALIHHLESRLPYILVAAVVLIGLLWLAIVYGIPSSAKHIAYRLPPSLLNIASQQTLGILDRSVLDPSALDDTVQSRLISHLQAAKSAHGDFDIQVIFRQGGRMGANAFALPNGNIIFTDEIVNLAKHDDELLSVMVHEIGHVVCRHSMRTIIQDSLLGFLLLAITGDISGSSELFLGLPILLTELAYSRDFEREADRFALDYMQQHNIPTIHFADLMSRLDKQSSAASKNGMQKVAGYLSTHPITEERIREFKR